MRVIYLLLSALLAILVFTSCNEGDSKDGANDMINHEANHPIIEFESDFYDFGDVKSGDKISNFFKFKNTGTKPLIVSNVKVTCGCTDPQWPKQPIAPGDSGVIEVKFESSSLGSTKKSITVISNGVPASKKISFTANIIAQPE